MSKMHLTEISERDLQMIQEWLKMDPYHRDVPVDMLKAPRTTSALIVDVEGPVLAFRLSHAVRADIQLNPKLWRSMRTKRALVFLARHLREAAVRDEKIREIVTSPGSKEMREFIEGLGFGDPVEDVSMWTVGTER